MGTRPNVLAVDAVPAQKLEITVRGVTAETGSIWITVCKESELAVRDEGGCSGSARVEAKDGVTAVFDSLAAGVHTASVWHDVDGNEVFGLDDRGIPLEPIGNSNNPLSSFGPPTFDQTKFTLEPASENSGTARLTIRIARIVIPSG